MHLSGNKLHSLHLFWKETELFLYIFRKEYFFFLFFYPYEPKENCTSFYESDLKWTERHTKGKFWEILFAYFVFFFLMFFFLFSNKCKISFRFHFRVSSLIWVICTLRIFKRYDIISSPTLPVKKNILARSKSSFF